MRKSKKLLASILIIALLVTSGIHALADENANVPTTDGQATSAEEPDDSGGELEGADEGAEDTGGLLCDLDDIYGCCTSDGDGELDLEDADIIEVEIDDEELEDYERMEMLFIAHPVLHAPDEQLIAVFFEEEEMVLTEATLHTRSLVTGEEFSHSYYMMIENTVSFVIDYQEGSGEDEILLVSVEYTFEGNEESVVLEFYDHNIETSYTVTNEPLPGSEESGIMVYGFGEDGEIISEETDIYNISETIEEIIYIIDDEAVADDSVEGTTAGASPVGIAPTSAGIAPMSGEVAQINPTTGAAPFTNRIIVVSAGHCSTHAGASANGLVEHELTWHVAGVVVNELNTFPGIRAIRDRPTIHCRWPGGGWQRCVTERVHQARRDGASMFVDIHFNAATNAAAHGAEIWIANTSRNDGMHQAGRALSDEILRRLSALGMHNRGHRMHANNQTEFASVRIARELGMVGILVEGGFLTNTGDANRIRDPNFRHRMGVEIARGIAAVNLGNVGMPPPPAPIVSTTTARDTNGRETIFDLRTTFSSGGARVTRVRFGVWSEHNGQNDVVWHEGVRQADGTWTARADVRNHRYPGRHRVNVWANTTTGETILTSRAEFYVRSATGGRVEIINSNPSGGTFDAVVRGVSAPSSVESVRVAVWTRANQSDLRWTTATRHADGSKRVRIHTVHHNFHVGTYHIRAHITTGNGQVLIRDTTHHVNSRPTATVSASDQNGRETLFNLSVTNAQFMGDIRGVNFAVWSEHNGQNDLVWYGSTLNNGVWRGTADVRRHRYPGRFHVNAWGVLPNNGRVFLGTTTFNVSIPTGGRLEIANNNPAGGTFDAVVRGVSTPSSVESVRVAVWTRANQSDLRWTTATRQADGSMRVRIQTVHHNFHVGTYHVRAHITTGNGQVFTRDTTHLINSRPTASVNVSDQTGRETLFSLSVTNAHFLGDIRGVNFAVWSEHNGQNDLIWYGSSLNNGVWRATADVRRHRYPGRFRVNAWGVLPNNERVFIGTTTFYVSRPTGGRVEIANSNPGAGTFDAVVRGVSTPSSVDSVRVAVWTRANQSDLRWTTATRQADGSMRVRIQATHHNYHSGTYHVRARITTGNGQVIVRDTTHVFHPNRPGTTGLIRIMGPTQTNVAQMVRNYRNTGHTFPSGALGMSLENFAQLVLTEANREGVRAEVLWSQVMRETGWLQFGGCVRINQFNFGGLGATGGGNPGHSFPSVQIGLRAQVHHLVAYATTAPVRNPSNRAHPIMRTSPPWGPTGQTVVNGTESPRFHFVARGISPYVNWLGQGENPNHPGFWAADRNYGAALAAAIRVLLNS